MSLQSTATFPARLSYVLKLHPEADPAGGRLVGRLEHIASGEFVEFAGSDELLAWLARHAVALQAPSTEGGDA